MCERLALYWLGPGALAVAGQDGDAFQPQAFRIVEDFGAQFIQIDSLCGHLPLASDAAYAKDLQQFRAHGDAAVLGGVRFKYQPVRSGQTLEEDLACKIFRCFCSNFLKSRGLPFKHQPNCHLCWYQHKTERK